MKETIRSASRPTPLLDRRAALVTGAAALIAGGGVLAYRRARPLAFEDVAGLPGFRRLVGSGAVTAGRAATIGLGGSGLDLPNAVLATARATVSADPFAALHGPRPAPVPVAFFTAAGCPLCAPQADRLHAVVPYATLRPLPLFGPTSDRAARAMIAAPAPWTLHDRLVGSAFRTDDAFIRAVVGTDDLLGAMDTPATDAALALNHVLAGRLGIPGTPATVIGRTIVVGVTSRSDLARLLDAERDRGAARP